MEPFSQSSLQGGAKSTGREGGRVSVPRYMPSDYRISSPPLEVLLTPTRPVTTPRFRVLLRPSALSDRTHNGADKSFITPLSPFNKNFLFSFLHCSPLLFSFFFRQAKVFLTSLERRRASVSPELSPRRVNTNGDPLRY